MVDPAPPIERAVMNRRFAASAVLGVAMALTSALTGALTPTVKLSQLQAQFSLERMIPTAFADWTVDASIVPLKPDPERQSVLEKIYDQTLSRTYVNKAGERVMLSIAYGGDQSRALQLHLPEVCYVAQGFDLLKPEQPQRADHLLDHGRRQGHQVQLRAEDPAPRLRPVGKDSRRDAGAGVDHPGRRNGGVPAAGPLRRPDARRARQQRPHAPARFGGPERLGRGPIR
jgi:hypothetical protein